MDRESAWLMVYSGIVAFQFHPGSKGSHSMSDCADLTDLAIIELEKRFPNLREVFSDER